MACNYVYKGKTYSEEAFKLLLANGELKQLKKEAKYNLQFGEARGKILGAMEQAKVKDEEFAKEKKELEKQLQKEVDLAFKFGSKEQQRIATEKLNEFKEKTKSEITNIKEESKTKLRAFKEKVKADIKEGKVKREQISGLISEYVKESLPSSGIPASETERIITAASKVTTEAQLDRFLRAYNNVIAKQYVRDQKLADENIAKEKKSVANKNRKKIKKAARSKESLDSDRIIFKSFASINPNEVEDIDKYNEIANQLSNTIKSGDRTITNEDVLKYVDEQTKATKEKQKQSLLEDNKDLVDSGVLNEGMSVEQIQEVLEGIEDTETTDDKEKKKEKINELKKKIEVKLATLLNEFEPETELEKELQVALTGLDLNGLKLNKLNLVNRVVDNILTNNSFAKAGDIILEYEIQEANRELAVELDRLGLDSIEEFITGGEQALNAFFKQYQLGIASVPSLIKKMTLNRDLAAVVRRVTGIQDLLSGHAKVINAMDNVNTEYEKLVNDNNNSYESQVKQSFASILSQNYGENIQEDFDRNKELVRQSVVQKARDEVRRLYGAKLIDKKTYEDYYGKKNEDGTYQEGLIESGVVNGKELTKNFPKGDFTEITVYDSVVSKANNIEEIYASMNEDEKKMVDFFRKKYAEIKDLLFENSEYFSNTVPELVNEYLPIVYSKSQYATIDQKEKDLLKDITNSMFMSDIINKQSTGSIISRQRNKNIPKGKVLSTDFHYDMLRKYREAQYQINTLKGRKLLSNVLDNTDFRNNMGVRNSDLLKEAAIRTITAHNNGFEANEFVKSAMKITNKLSNIGVKMALASPLTGRLKQTLPVLTGAAIKLGKRAHLLYTLPPVNNDLLKYSNLSERIKTKAGLQTDSYTNDKDLVAVRNEYVQMYKKAYNWTEAKASSAADWMMGSITRGDQAAAKKAWMAYYTSYRMKRDGVKEINWEAESNNPSKEASAYADQLLEETQSTNSFATLGNFLLKTRNWQDILRNIYAPFSTFILNQRSRLINASRMIRKGNVSEGLEEIAAVTFESVTFSGIRITLGLASVYLGRELLKALGYSDDEAEEMIKFPVVEDLVKRASGDLAKDLLVTGFIGADAPASEAINWSYKKLSGDKKDLVYVNKTGEQDWADWLGTYGIALDNFANAYEDASKLIYGAEDVTKGGLKPETELKPLSERETDAFTLFLIHDISKVLINEQMISNTLNKAKRAIEKDMETERGTSFDLKMYKPGEKYKKDESSDGRGGRTKSRLKGRKIKKR